MDIEQLIKSGFSVREYRKDSIIYEPGGLPRYVYFIKWGEVRMVTVSDEGKEFIQGIFKSGQYFGEPAMIVNRRYLAFTIANKNSQLVAVGKDQFFDLIKQDPEFSTGLIQTLSHRLFYKSMMLEELANEKAEHRLLTIINYLLIDVKAGEPLKATRRELADMTGLRVETVIRGVKVLADKKMITVEKGKIVKAEAFAG
ncbi:Crp/Fnr family transcriptional regulator [Pedobacter endophyticus]|uniref:Crp/Fnr family transcriptional regulator n=1 Tax=Pedobacter endophyticus TaxID=2789740 RepID=A0A7S9KZP0_9SPHI|nr:Crp/Fnr family transcriptional regulator [Pedobacter endophyticus]QPH39823.1 Crp/Fnr family transcriptional regulator [Pedobacter endophyticus]